MADTGFQLILNAIAQVVGGTALATVPHFYSGQRAADGTGVSGLAGCWSTDPPNPGKTPVGIVIPDQFTAELASQGEETQNDTLKLYILVAPYTGGPYDLPQLTPYRDTVPAVFRSHMSALNSAGVLWSWIGGGRLRLYQVGGTEYLAWEFTVELERSLSVTYTP